VEPASEEEGGSLLGEATDLMRKHRIERGASSGGREAALAGFWSPGEAVALRG